MKAPIDRSRRRLLGAAAGTALLHLPGALAQPGKGIARVACSATTPERARATIREILAKAGFVDGRNLRLEFYPFFRVPAGEAEARAKEVIAARPDVIFTIFGPEVVLLKHLTRDIPIVASNCPSDPMRGGLVESLGRPGGNITGTYHDFQPLMLKRWFLFKQVLPSLTRGAMLASTASFEPPAWKNRDAANAYARGFLGKEREVNALAERELGIRIIEIVVPDGASGEQVIEAVRRVRPEAMRIGYDRDSKVLDEYLVSERILTDMVVRAGVFDPDMFRAGIEMVGRILRGERPATMPVIQGTRYVVKLNPRLAKEMGFTIPRSILLEAEVIEGGA